MTDTKSNISIERLNRKLASVIPNAPPVEKVEFLTAAMLAERVMQDHLGSNVEHLNLAKGSSFEFWPSNGDTVFKIIATTDLKVLDVVPTPKEAGNTAHDRSGVNPWLSVVPSAALSLRNETLGGRGTMSLDFHQEDFKRAISEHKVNLAAPASVSTGRQQRKPISLDDFNKPLGDPKVNEVLSAINQAKQMTAGEQTASASTSMSFKLFDEIAAENQKLTKARHEREIPNILPPPKATPPAPQQQVYGPPRSTAAPPIIGPDRRLNTSRSR